MMFGHDRRTFPSRLEPEIVSVGELLYRQEYPDSTRWRVSMEPPGTELYSGIKLSRDYWTVYILRNGEYFSLELTFTKWGARIAAFEALARIDRVLRERGL